MAYSPRYAIKDCPNCGREPTVRFGWFLRHVRLACACGVSGPFARNDGERDAWWPAASAWTRVFGPPFPPRPEPTPREPKPGTMDTTSVIAAAFGLTWDEAADFLDRHGLPATIDRLSKHGRTA